jgi:hypothetical protein
MIDLRDTLALLSEDRPIFHSEADFQHALAWLIHRRNPDAHIRLEYRLSRPEREYLDLWVKDDACGLAIELKYPTRGLSMEHTGEQFLLLNHGAQDLTRYDFVKDICRVERWVHTRQGATGYAILLTNDSSYWTTPARTDTIDAAFRIHESVQWSGTRTWGPQTSAGTMKGRESALELRGSFEMSWHDYSLVGANPNGGRFRYLLVRVEPDALSHR